MSARRLAHLHEPDRVALAHDPLDQYRRVDPSRAAMGLRDVMQHASLRLPCVGVERDHLAAWVPLQDRDPQPLADLQRTTDQLVLTVGIAIAPVRVEVGAETAPVHLHTGVLGSNPRNFQNLYDSIA